MRRSPSRSRRSPMVSGTRTEGGVVSGAQAADSDPNAPGATYGTTSEVAGTGGTVSSTSGSTSITFTAPPGDTGSADVAVAAGGANVCPPPTDLAETDGLPCAGGRMQQGERCRRSFHWAASCRGLGSATLASVAAAAEQPGQVVRRPRGRQRPRREDRSHRDTERRRHRGSARSRPASRRPPVSPICCGCRRATQDTVTSQAGTTTTAAPSDRNPDGQRLVLERRRLHDRSARRPPVSTT